MPAPDRGLAPPTDERRGFMVQCTPSDRGGHKPKRAPARRGFTPLFRAGGRAPKAGSRRLFSKFRNVNTPFFNIAVHFVPLLFEFHDFITVYDRLIETFELVGLMSPNVEITFICEQVTG